MKNINNWPNCGAPITTEICPYCKAKTGLDTKYADMEYPVIECKEAILNFWNTLFPGIFAFMFGGAGLMTFLIGRRVESSFGGFSFGSQFMSLPFILIGVIAFVIIIKNVIRYLLIKSRGKEIIATVYGYMDDNMMLNNSPAQIVKLLVDTNDGKKFILYQLRDTKRPYKVNSTISLLVYKNSFLIIDNKKNYFN